MTSCGSWPRRSSCRHAPVSGESASRTAKNNWLGGSNAGRECRGDGSAHRLHRLLRIPEIEDQRIVPFADMNEPAVPFGADERGVVAAGRRQVDVLPIHLGGPFGTVKRDRRKP